MFNTIFECSFSLNQFNVHQFKVEYCVHNTTNMKTPHTTLRRKSKHYIILKFINITF